MIDGREMIVGWHKLYHEAYTFFSDNGFLAYTIDFYDEGKKTLKYASIINVYDAHNGRKLYVDFFKMMVVMKVKYCLGEVDISLDYHPKLLLLYAYYGAKIVKIEDNKILTFRKEL